MPVYNAPIASLSTLTPQQQENLILMADTDVRSILQSLEAVAALQALQSASIMLNSAGIAELKSITVVERIKQLDRANFVFAAGFWNANVLHELKNQYPITAIYDASGDIQFIQFVGKDINNGTVELTQSQYDSNSFPLKIVLHSYLDASIVNPTDPVWKVNPQNGKYYRLFNNFLQNSINGLTVLNSVNGSILEAYMPTYDNVVLVRTIAGTYIFIELELVGSDVDATESDFNLAKNSADSIQL